MAYNKVYEVKFSDVLNTNNTENWRVDILDEEGTQGTIPISLIPANTPLVLDTVDASENKNKTIVGQQATLSYEYTGISDHPLPTLFFDKDERRFQLKIYKDNQLKNTFWVNPAGGGWPDKYPPFTVSLTAVDGLSFLQGINWNAYTSTGLLDYRWMSLYEIMIERALFQSLDETDVNVLCTLKPANIGGSKSFLNDLYMHSDMFYDFVNGPLNCYQVLDMICKTFGLQIKTDQNIIWIYRPSDLLNQPLIAENYNAGVMNTIQLQANERFIAYNSNDGKAVNANAENINFQAIKRVEYDIEYKGINVLKNFLWNDWNGTNFNLWRIQSPQTLQRLGTGTIQDPYRAFLNYISEAQPDVSGNISQGTNLDNVMNVNIGMAVQLSFKYQYYNVTSFFIGIRAFNIDTAQGIELDSSGSWVLSDVSNPGPFPTQLTRTGKKNNGSFTLKSTQIPTKINDVILIPGNWRVSFTIYSPIGFDIIDGGPLNGVAIYPVKFAILGGTELGKNIVSENTGRYSKKIEKTSLFFIDTGIKTLSNTIAVDNTGTPSTNWSTLQKSTLEPIQKKSSDGSIIQYSRTVSVWQSDVRSNSINANNTLNLYGKQGKQFLQITDSYDVRASERKYNLQEILKDDELTTEYTETDITDSNN